MCNGLLKKPFLGAFLVGGMLEVFSCMILLNSMILSLPGIFYLAEVRMRFETYKSMCADQVKTIFIHVFTDSEGQDVKMKESSLAIWRLICRRVLIKMISSDLLR